MNTFTAAFVATDGAVTFDGLMDNARLTLDLTGTENVRAAIAATLPMAGNAFVVTVAGQTFLASLPPRSALRISGTYKTALLKMVVPKTHVAEALAAVAILAGDEAEFVIREALP